MGKRILAYRRGIVPSKMNKSWHRSIVVTRLVPAQVGNHKGCPYDFEARLIAYYKRLRQREDIAVLRQVDPHSDFGIVPADMNRVLARWYIKHH